MGSEGGGLSGFSFRELNLGGSTRQVVGYELMGESRRRG